MPSAHPDMPESKFAYTWSRTWRIARTTSSRRDGDLRIGRVFRIEGGPGDGRWKWAMTASRGNLLGSVSGVADSRDDACQMVEVTIAGLLPTGPEPQKLKRAGRAVRPVCGRATGGALGFDSQHLKISKVQRLEVSVTTREEHLSLVAKKAGRRKALFDKPDWNPASVAQGNARQFFEKCW